MNKKSSKVKKIKFDSDGSDKVNVEFIGQPNKVKESESSKSFKKTVKNKTPSLKQTAYLPINHHVKPVFWSGRHYLHIAEFAIPK